MPHENSPIGAASRRKPASGLRPAIATGSELMSIQEAMHGRIASELHDSTCQHLVAASLGVMQMRNALGDPRKADEICEQIDVSLNQALRELRSITYLLHPQRLLDEGLKASIEQYSEGFAVRTSLRIEMSISIAVDYLPCDVQRSIMRIVQEALMNVHRHAKATKVQVSIAVKASHFELEVRDNGRGMKLQDHGPRMHPSPGTGLRIIQARLQEIGGALHIASMSTSRRRGTTLRATFPSSLTISQNSRKIPRKKCV